MQTMTAAVRAPDPWGSPAANETDIDPIVSELTDSVDDLGRLLSSTANVAWAPPQNRFPVCPESDPEDGSPPEAKEEEGVVFYSSPASTSSETGTPTSLSADEFWTLTAAPGNGQLAVLRDKKGKMTAEDLRRWSAVSMASQRPADAANCDCTTLAFSTLKGKSKNRLKALKEQEESYQKAKKPSTSSSSTCSASSSTPPDSPDSGVDSSSSCSEDKVKAVVPLPKSPSKNKKNQRKSQTSTISLFLNSFMYKMFRVQRVKTTTANSTVEKRKEIENQPAFSPRWRNDPVNEAQPLSAPRVGQMGTGTTPTVIKLNTPPMKCNVDFGLDQSTSNLSLTTATTIATAKSLSFNDSINLTAAEPKKLPPVTTPTRSKVAGRLANSEKFYFPTGKPLSKMENDGVLRGVQKYFGGRQLLFKDFAEIARIVGFPVYSKRAIFEACCRCNSKPITDATAVPFEAFAKYWEKMILQNHDEASRFVFTLTVAKTGLPARNYLVREDFHSMFYDLIQTYPGLQFLIEATQFHARYVEVVTARIFWNVNRSWSGKITVAELRQSNLLPTMHLLEETDEINKITEYFSYEHFYVIYCKFWELDEDHDMVISKDDMRMHCNGALTNRIIDRIFSTAVTRVPRKPGCPPPPKSGVLEVIGFEEFVAFLLAEEDKRHPKAVEYWFRCIDLDGDGIISLYEMEMFYKDVALKIQQKGYETLDFKDVASQLYDLVSPGSGQIMLKDLKKCGLAHRFFNTFVNYLKYLEQESADGERASVKMNGDKEMSDWDQFCALEYEMLMTEADQGEDGNDEAYDLVVDDDEQEDMTSANIGSNDSAVNGF